MEMCMDIFTKLNEFSFNFINGSCCSLNKITVQLETYVCSVQLIAAANRPKPFLLSAPLSLKNLDILCVCVFVSHGCMAF